MSKKRIIGMDMRAESVRVIRLAIGRLVGPHPKASEMTSAPKLLVIIASIAVAFVPAATAPAAGTPHMATTLGDETIGHAPPVAFLRPGVLDPTFDRDGKVITDFGGNDLAAGVTVQADGKIVAVGETSSGDDFALARYNADGTLDSTFGNGGMVRTDFGGSSDFARAVAIQADGKIVAAGGSSGGSGDFALARYNPDGSFDSSFGGSGKIVTNLQRTEYALAVTIQPGGKIVAVGQTTPSAGPNGYDFAVVRYNADGSLDTSFGGTGYVVTAFTSTLDAATSVLVQPDGKIVAAGVANAGSPSTQDLALARYNADGSLDASFDGDGKVDTPDSSASGAWSVAIQADSKLVVGGGIVARYNANGALDPGFGSSGKVTLPGASAARIVLVQPDRKLVVAGVLSKQQDNDFLVARLKPDGSEDTSFGDKGQTSTDFGSNSEDGVLAAALQSDRRIVVAGYASAVNGGPADFALARYLNPAPVTCRVPNVRGKKLALAKSAITKAHCRIGKVRRKASTRVRRGRVIFQRPIAGTRLPNLGKVNLIVSRGKG